MKRILSHSALRFALGGFFIVIAVFAIAASPLRPKPFSDGYFHEEAKALARALAAGDWSLATPIVHSPLAPWYYLPPYLAVSPCAQEESYWTAGVLWNCLWLCASAMFLRDAARRLAPGNAGWFAAVGVPLSFFPLYYAAGIATETPAYAAASAAVAAGLRLFSRTSEGHRGIWLPTLGLGVAIGLLVGIRGNYILAVPLVLLLALRYWRGSLRRPLLAAGVIAAAVIGVVYGGTSLFNRARGGPPGQDSFLTHVLIQGAYQYRGEPLDWRAWEEEARNGSTDHARYRALRRDLDARRDSTGRRMSDIELEWIRWSLRHEPHQWLKMAPFKAISALIFRVSPVRVERVFGQGWKATAIAVTIVTVLNLPILLLTVIALWGTARTGLVGSSVCWLPFTAGLLFIAFSYSEPRYMVPAHSGIVALAAGVLSVWWQRLAGQKEASPGVWQG